VSYIQLRAMTPLFREDNGTTHILLPQGGSLRFGIGLAPFLDELAKGISELEWHQRVNTNSLAAQVDFALSEHHLLGHADKLHAAPSFRHLPSSEIGAATWWVHVLTLLACAMTAAIYYINTSTSIAVQIPWQWSLLIPIALAFTVLCHEIGHYSAARLCGRSAVIRIWRNGALLPRCEIKPGEPPFTVKHKLWILSAGPWSDCILLFVTTAYLSFTGKSPLAKIFAACALLFLISNLWPNSQSDFSRMLSLAPNKMFKLWVMRICWILLPLITIACLIASITSFGLFPINLF